MYFKVMFCVGGGNDNLKNEDLPCRRYLAVKSTTTILEKQDDVTSAVNGAAGLTFPVVW